MLGLNLYVPANPAGAVSDICRSMPSESSPDPLFGMAADALEPRTLEKRFCPRPPFTVCPGQVLLPDVADHAVSGPLTMPAASGSPVPHWAASTGIPLVAVHPDAATYRPPGASWIGDDRGTKFHALRVSV